MSSRNPNRPRKLFPRTRVSRSLALSKLTQCALTLLTLVLIGATSCSMSSFNAMPQHAPANPEVSDIAAAAPLPSKDIAVYYLPFEAGTTHFVGQGNFGVGGLGSHVGQYAIDFVMPEGTPVLAARDGAVVAIRQDCPNVNCPFEPEACCGNYVKIRHADGTVAAYWHLPQDGACVKVGRIVSRGDVIAHSGNTGISLTPHLHFAVYAAPGQPGDGRQGTSTDRSMEVSFIDVPGDGVPTFLGTYTSENAFGQDHCSEPATK